MFQTQSLASSLRRKRSSSQPATATRTLPRMPSAGKQSLEADLQFVPGDKNFNSVRKKKDFFKKLDKKDKSGERQSLNGNQPDVVQGPKL